MTSASETASGTARGWYAVGLLGCLYIVSLLDRLILGLLVEPLRADLHITDTQVSLLMGVAFAFFYAVVGLPLGRVADIGNRKWLIGAAALIWGGCTAASALATSFTVLCLLRIGVAVGEAALTPATISMISDLFPERQRGLATSIFMSVGALGATGAYILGGLLVKLVGAADHTTLPLIGLVKPWQVVFLSVGAPAFLIATVIALTFREPVRHGAAAKGFGGFTFAWARPPYFPAFLFFVATGIGQVIAYALSGWAPTYLVRRFGWATGDAGIWVGIAGMTLGVSGMMIAPRAAELWRRRGRHEAPVLVLAIGLLVGAPLAIAATLAPSSQVFVGLYGLAMFCLMGTGMMPFMSVQWGIPPRLKGEVLAAGMLANSLIGIALGPTVAVLASKLFGGGAHLGPGLALVAAICGPVGAVFALALRPSMRRILAAEGDESRLQPPSDGLPVGRPVQEPA